MTETNLNGQSLDILEENIKNIKTLFPEVECEGKVDFDKLKQILGDYVEESKERYNFSWNGKGRALRLAQSPSTGTLRPCIDESKNFDTTGNLYIEGDNLEVLKLLQKSYHSKIKMIYIDPPYNTGKDFVYKDNFKDNIQNYLETTGQIDGEGNKIGTNSESNGRYHTDWLNMMYPRLRLARNLLTNDGVIFISIDDNEVDNLKKLCNEVFGEDNFVADLVWRKKAGGANDSTDIAVEHEYIICYKKHDNGIFKIPLSEDRIKEYKFSDEKEEARGKYTIKNLNDKSLQDSSGLHFDILCPDGSILKGTENQWKCNQETFHKRLEDNRIIFKQKSNSEWTCNYKIYLNEEKGQLKYDEEGNIVKKGKNLSSLIDNVLNKDGAEEVKNIFKSYPFSYPKPSKLIYQLIQCSAKKDSIILDFFSGSATTAHAVMQLNSEDGGNRKFICVQLPEITDEKSEAFKAGYKNICEIGKERIRRAGKKLTETDGQMELGAEQKPIDIGFKVFKLDTSNIKKWQPDYDDLESSLFDSIYNYVDGRSDIDVVYEIMIKYGLDLTYTVEELNVDGKTIYSIGFGMLIICLDKDLTTDIANFIVKYKKDNDIEDMRVVFKDNGFKDDSNKTNIKEILKCGNIKEFITI